MASSIISSARSKKRAREWLGQLPSCSPGVIEAGDGEVTERIPPHQWKSGQLPALDGRLGLRVENVKPGTPHGNAQLVGHPPPRGRLDARHHDTLADLHIEQDFRAEL